MSFAVKRSYRSRRFTVMISVGIVTGVLAACTNQTQSIERSTPVLPSYVDITPHTNTAPLTTAVPGRITSTTAVSKEMKYQKQIGIYPIEAYLFSDSEDTEFASAVNRLVEQCMSKYDLHFTPDPGVKKHIGDSRRYGITDLSLAAKYGYHLSADFLPKLNQGEEGVAGNLADYDLAFNGNQSQQVGGPLLTTIPSGTVNGKPVYPGGCIGHARFQLADSDTAPGHAEVAVAIDHKSFYEAEASTSVQAAIRLWSACMATYGLKYSDPLAASNSFSSDDVTNTEIRTAEADISCKTRTNLVKVWADQEVVIQTASIAAKRSDMDAVSRRVDSELERAEAVLTSS